MKLIFLGTSHGAPEIGSFCSSTLLETGEVSYLVDCGAPVVAQMVNMGKVFERIRAVFITHMHEDHVASLTSVLKGYSKRNSTAYATFFFPEKAGLEGFLVWIKAIHRRPDPQRLKFELSAPGVFFEDEDVRVSGILTDHIPGYPTYAYRVELKKEQKKILFTGDVADDMHDFPKEAWTEEWDVIVSELTHFRIQEQIEQFKTMKTKQLIFNHKHRRNLEVIDQIIPWLPYPARVACDGDEFEF